MLTLFAAILIIFAVTQVAGRLAKFLGQPPVIGEIAGGILLGPSVFGALAADLQYSLFPDHIMPVLGQLAEIGVVLFMFFIGLELDLNALKEKRKAILSISAASILLPAALGVALSLAIHAEYAPLPATPLVFALFVGVAMSITAFPVLARILTDLGMHRTETGRIALACAALGDAAAWMFLAITVKIAQAPPQQTAHAFLIFGAFLLGASVSNGKWRAHPFPHRAMDWVRTWILPLFFAYSGLRTQLRLIETPMDWAVCLGIIAIASFGKCVGAFAAAKWAGLPTKTAAILGALMNARGLVELIVLNIGLNLGLISPRLFAMFVVMALVTTCMAGPLTIWLNRKPSVA